MTAVNIQHNDMSGRAISVGDVVTFVDKYELGFGTVTKLTPKCVSVQRIQKAYRMPKVETVSMLGYRLFIMRDAEQGVELFKQEQLTNYSKD
jgi:hypothetical protein